MELSINESPAIEALGPLFKFTEVRLWEYGFSDFRESFYHHEPRMICNGDFDYKGEGITVTNVENGCLTSEDDFPGLSLLSEDVELAKELSELGLPLSFGTNKEKRNGVNSGKRKGLRKNNQLSPIKMDNTLSKHDIIADIDSLSISLETVDSMSSTACTFDDFGEVSDLGFDHFSGQSSKPGKCIPIEAETSPYGSCLTNDDADFHGKEIKGEIESAHVWAPLDQSNDISFEVAHDADSVEWKVYWDDFHQRTYFYNVKTEESTWDPPPGMEHLAFGNISDELEHIAGLNNQIPFVYLDEELFKEDVSISQEFDEIADNVFSTYSTKKKKKVETKKSNMNLPLSSEYLQGVLQDVTPSISKYWFQRYILFSKFDHGIKMDEEGWFSVTPECIAKHHALRCGGGSIVDFFTGVGGNAIQFAQRFKHVTAIDIDPNKIEYARYNAAIYGVEDNIDFICADSFSLVPKLKAETVFMSPPWGGPDYSKVMKFDINSMLKPRDGKFLFHVGKKIASKIVMFLPRNVDLNQLAEISLSASPPWSLEVERNFLNDRLKAVTAYFSEPSVA